MRISVVLFLILGVLSGCGDDGPGQRDSGVPPRNDGGGRDGGEPLVCIDGLAAITLSPVQSPLILDGGTPTPVMLTATGRFANGSTQALDAGRLQWSATRADDTPPGTVAGGLFQPYALAGGTVTIQATDGCITGELTVELVLQVAVGTPTNPDEWTTTPVTDGAVPTIVYPSDQTRFPRNIYRILFQWRSAGFTEFRLTFTGAASKVTVYTDGAHADCAGANPAAGCWEADETAWSFIAGSNAGGTVTVDVDALDRTTPTPTIRRARSITIGFSRRDVKGAIFYWSTTSAGIRRANITAAVPEDYITGKPGTVYEDGDGVNCVACHVVSRDGRYIAAPVKADSGESLWIMEVSAAAPPPPLVKQVTGTKGHGFATISPDNAHVAAAWAGKMWLVDRATGAYIEDVPLGAVAEVTQPDWSPDGKHIVVATGKGDGPGGASIAAIPFNGLGSWGEPRILVPAEGDRTNLFPMYSPEGEWIAFSRGKGGHGDLTAQLFVVPGAGGTPVELLAANRIVSNQESDGQHQNSLPTWAPPGDLHWIAFNSMREYGVVLGAGTQQIWVAAVDTSKIGTGADPSFPAFRIPFQGLNEDNHRAYWTLDVREEPPPPPLVDAGVPPDAGPCIELGQTCDPVANTCCVASAVCDTQNDVDYTCFIPNVP
jgi:Tol biopolymer transport system component